MNVGVSTMAKWVAQLKQERQGKPYAATTPMTPDCNPPDVSTLFRTQFYIDFC